MNGVRLYVDGIGLHAPGMAGWSQGCEVLGGRAAFVAEVPPLAAPQALPPTERRRVGLPVRLSMAIGLEAARQAQVDVATLATVFSSTGGDCDNCHHLLDTLASPDRTVSPTRFHNSVHNAPSGYWGIATGCRLPSTTLCAYDATFCAGLTEAVSQVSQTGEACLLLAYDTAYPEPLYALRPIPHAAGIALVLAPKQSERSLARLEIVPDAGVPGRMEDAALEQLRTRVPAARGLPLLQALARQQPAEVVLEYLDAFHLRIGVMPCI
ncbi:MAG: beta-ketoacyl synthase chain length factor [Betaproteobacteria bacterium]|nr:beta-ketoacyl synthase chain length factor [Betaproteobacteria bacterium]